MEGRGEQLAHVRNLALEIGRQKLIKYKSPERQKVECLNYVLGGFDEFGDIFTGAIALASTLAIL